MGCPRQQRHAGSLLPAPTMHCAGPPCPHRRSGEAARRPLSCTCLSPTPISPQTLGCCRWVAGWWQAGWAGAHVGESLAALGSPPTSVGCCRWVVGGRGLALWGLLARAGESLATVRGDRWRQCSTAGCRRWVHRGGGWCQPDSGALLLAATPALKAALSQDCADAYSWSGGTCSVLGARFRAHGLASSRCRQISTGFSAQGASLGRRAAHSTALLGVPPPDAGGSAGTVRRVRKVRPCKTRPLRLPHLLPSVGSAAARSVPPGGWPRAARPSCCW